MAQLAVPAPTFDELYARIAALPEGVTGEILQPGVLRTMSRPGRHHARALKHCGAALSSFDIDLGGTGWWLLVEYEIRFPYNRLAVPDMAGWRVERVPSLPDENPMTVVPDWCCEVLSPSTSRVDRTEKLPLYAECGVPWVWLVDPSFRTIEVYETVSGRAALTASAREDDIKSLPPFEVPIALAAWWQPEEQDAAAVPSEAEGNPKRA
jgi:Uma2 family endonuclease